MQNIGQYRIFSVRLIDNEAHYLYFVVLCSCAPALWDNITYYFGALLSVISGP